VDGPEHAKADDGSPARDDDLIRRAVWRYVAYSVPAPNFDDYANQVYEANRAAGL
jgi:hypothetical protein